MTLRPLRTIRIAAQEAHQRATNWIWLLLAVNDRRHQAERIPAFACKRDISSHRRRPEPCALPGTFSTKESRWHIYGAPREEPKLSNQ
jgi:hypothetical protein